MFETIKAYASAIKLVAVFAIITLIAFAWWYHGHQSYLKGKAEVRALWDTDKAQRKEKADQQAAATSQFNQEKNDALEHSEKSLRDTRNNLDVALKRMRDIPAVPGGAGMLMAGCGSTAVSGVATDPGRVGIQIEKRIGRCENTGADPCYTGREFFEQAIGDALNRKATREWAAGQGIQTRSEKK